LIQSYGNSIIIINIKPIGQQLNNNRRKIMKINPELWQLNINQKIIIINSELQSISNNYGTLELPPTISLLKLIK